MFAETRQESFMLETVDFDSARCLVMETALMYSIIRF
jgi:hypothetical protein